MSTDPVLITGVSRRLGLHLALTFQKRSVPVIGTYRTRRRSIDELECMGIELYQCDFHDEFQVQQLIRSITDRHHRLRAIIHNASDWLPDNAQATPTEIMQKMMQVHVHAPYQLNLALEPLLLATTQQLADIIHVGDFVSSRGSKKHIAYAASKAAQDNLTLSFASKLAPKVKVNSLAPALVLFNEADDDDYRQKSLNKSLMKREAGLDEFQKAVDYLLHSNYLTGRVLPMDGGRHLC